MSRTTLLTAPRKNYNRLLVRKRQVDVAIEELRRLWPSAIDRTFINRNINLLEAELNDINDKIACY